MIPAPYAEECSYHLYELIVPDREVLLAKLAERGINCGVHYPENTEYKVFSYGEGQAPHAREVTQHLITMPLHLWLSDDDVKYIIDSVNELV